MVSLDVSQRVCRNGYLAQGVWAEGRELMISAQISWLENVACSSHELALTQPDLLQKWLENPQTTADLEVFRLQSQRLFWFSKCWRSLRMTENLSRCTAHISILYTSIGCSLRSLKCKWFLHKRTSTILWPTEKSLLLPPRCVRLAVEVPALDNLALWPYSALPSEKTAMQPLHYYVLYIILLWPVKGYRGRGMLSSRRSLVQD